MGDHRASIKCVVEMHGVKRECDMWINYNYCGGTVPFIDDRILDFFSSWAEEAREVYDRQEFESRRIEREHEERAAELKELARLKQKYGEG